MSKTNAKQEIIEHIGEYVSTGLSGVKCSCVEYIEYYKKIHKKFKLKTNHTPTELKEFLESLNFEYDSSYGSQELFGTVWYEDGTWSSRGEYDGSEWWDFNTVPSIPEGLIK